MKARRGPLAQALQVVLSPRLAKIRRIDNAKRIGRNRRVVAREDHAVFDQHVGDLVLGVEEHLVLGLICQILRVAAKDAAVVWLGAIRVRAPVKLAVHEVNPARLIAGVHAVRYEDLPVPLVGRPVVGTTQPVTLVLEFAIDLLVMIARASIEGVLVGVVGNAMDMSSDDRVVGVTQ